MTVATYGEFPTTDEIARKAIRELGAAGAGRATYRRATVQQTSHKGRAYRVRVVAVHEGATLIGFMRKKVGGNIDWTAATLTLAMRTLELEEADAERSAR